jgi:hypothetical protein
MPITLTTPDTPATATILYVIVISVTHSIDDIGPRQTSLIWCQSDAAGKQTGAFTNEVLTTAALNTFHTTAGSERVKAYAALQTLHPEFAGTLV